jgi:hypothetical protein
MLPKQSFGGAVKAYINLVSKEYYQIPNPKFVILVVLVCIGSIPPKVVQYWYVLGFFPLVVGV